MTTTAMRLFQNLLQDHNFGFYGIESLNNAYREEMETIIKAEMASGINHLHIPRKAAYALLRDEFTG